MTLNPISTPPHSRSLDFAASINGLSASSLRQFPLTRFSLPSSSSSSNYLNGWISTPPPDRDGEPRGVEARAAESCAGEEEEEEEASGLSKTLELGGLEPLSSQKLYCYLGDADRGIKPRKVGEEEGYCFGNSMESGLVLITVWTVEQEDRSLVNEWTPLMDKYNEEWIGPSDPCICIPPSLTLESIPEVEENSMGKNIMDTSLITKLPKLCMQLLEAKVIYWQLKMEKMLETSKSFSSLGIGLIHRAEVGGVSTCALANGLGKKDDKKSAAVYNRYYHVFSEGELESDLKSVPRRGVRRPYGASQVRERSSILKQLNGTDVLNAMKSGFIEGEENAEKAKEKEENEHLVDELTKISHP
ncbi:hypothetical protein RHMOL_Rhmol10G0152700 [Rhododendron molle]|uniref:Uncharacterized protein n=4 Tax=Rhododendron molle TaxID=49168 RepID=A0ACC0M280_RHOML|nr:hypothetical protein RHMOL_Rhmol10G0152700 [Rhododendron molle]KAI8535143.1 hypothetical protein RHMOL_Rhmol10G0152700 [Rhododendron molle]KAI8535147.1 hypothetical protein RHMOL_Rhmol10G0152700 [Rhododendron molle]KAI8535149.1 hypothetical protein RHMOL_Rhmol10G0152700 [Rhododendron molle]